VTIINSQGAFKP